MKKQLIKFLLKTAFLIGTIAAVFTCILSLYRMTGNSMFPSVRDGDLCLFYRLEDLIVLIGCLFLFLIGLYGLYGLYDSNLVYQDANDTSLLKNKPGYESEGAEKTIQGNMAAWLTLDDTKIDYPVMQGEDNTEYLNKNPYGE